MHGPVRGEEAGYDGSGHAGESDDREGGPWKRVGDGRIAEPVTYTGQQWTGEGDAEGYGEDEGDSDERERFGDDHCADVEGAGSESAKDADLSGALEHGHGHGVGKTEHP